MQYDLQKSLHVRGESLDIGMPYGDMPPSLLTNKYEETNLDEDEMITHNYLRALMLDRGCDAPAFESDLPRKSGHNGGRLKVQYNGHRGDADPAAHPEIFLGFAGPENRDPRGTATDPDFKQLRAQQELRVHSIRMDPDMSAHTTGGARSETREIRDNHNALFSAVRKMKVFSRMLIGKSNTSGAKATGESVARLTKIDTASAYGDSTRDAAARARGYKRHEDTRDAREYMTDTADLHEPVANYSHIRSARKNKGDKDIMRVGVVILSNDSDAVRARKALCIKMKTMAREARVDLTADSAHARALALSRGSASGVSSRGTQDTTYKNSDTSMIRKLNSREVAAVSRDVVDDMEKYASVASVVYKQVNQEAKHSRDTFIDIDDTSKLTRTAKSTRAQRMELAVRNIQGDADQTDNMQIHNYKVNHTDVKGSEISAVERFAKESDLTLLAKNRGGTPVGVSTDGEHMKEFSNNTSKERHIAPMGTKYTRGLSMRESSVSEMDEFT